MSLPGIVELIDDYTQLKENYEKLQKENERLKKAARTIIKYLKPEMDEDDWVYSGFSYLEEVLKESTDGGKQNENL